MLVGCANATITSFNNTTGIQNAINNASSGDTIELSAGTYNEHDIVVNKDLNIQGPAILGDNPPSAVVDAQNLGRVFYIPSGVNVNLKNLIILNGYSPDGSGIFNSGTLNIDNCLISNSTAGVGGGITNRGICIVTSSTLKNNTANDGGGIFNQGNFTVNISNINDNNAVWSSGGIFNNGNFTVNSSNINNNSAYSGGGICNLGNFIVTSSDINFNKANDGGGIYNGEICNCTVTGSNINNNVANSLGGGINNNNGNLNIINCNIKNNNADYGGGILIGSVGTCTISGSMIINNTAAGSGGGIYNNGGTFIAHFNRFYNNTALNGNIIVNTGYVDATLNWWGTNKPTSLIVGNIIFNPWLVLNLTANPPTFKGNSTSTIKADLTHDNTGTYYNPSIGHVPDGIPINFKTSLGTITSSAKLVNGIATVTFKSGLTSGIANINATLDNEIVNCSVTIDTIVPTIKVGNPLNGATNITRNKIITITFSEAVKWGNKWITIQANGVTMPTSSYTMTLSSDGKTLTIKSVFLWATSTLYALIFHTGSLTDLAGNNLSLTSRSFLTTNDGTAPTIKTPLSGITTSITRTQNMTITFSEAVKWGNKWITIQANGVTIPTSAYTLSLSSDGKTLIIKPTTSWNANTTYNIILHTGCVTDLAGNNLALTSRSFKTGST